MSQIEKDAEAKGNCYLQEAAENGEEIYAEVSEANALESDLFGPLDPGLVASLDTPSSSQLDRMLGVTSET